MQRDKQQKRRFLKKLLRAFFKKKLLRALSKIVGTLAVGFLAGLLAQAIFDPFIKPFLPWLKFPASVQIEVRYPDGRLVACEEITKVLLYRYLPAKRDFKLFREENSPLPVVRWDDIPPGQYAVEAYVTDMYAGGAGWDPKLPITIASAAKRTITIEIIPQAKLRFCVYQQDGQTPLTGAWVESLLLKVVLIRVDARIAFQGSVAWQVRVYPNLTFYLSLRPVGAGARCPSSTFRPPLQAPPATA